MTVQHRYIVSLLVSDRVGVLRSITSAISNLGGNIDGISQTVVTGYFTVTLTASFNHERNPDDLRASIEEDFGRGEASVIVRPYEARAAQRRAVEGESYIATLTGRDRPGILKAVTAFLSAKGINIEDWFVAFRGDFVTHVGEITVPASLDIKQLQDEFQQLLSPMGLTIGIQHENIFRATNEIGPIKSLLSRQAGGDRRLTP